jgi:hypothetical protein
MKFLVMDLEENKSRNDCAGEEQQQLIRPTDLRRKKAAELFEFN